MEKKGNLFDSRGTDNPPNDSLGVPPIPPVFRRLLYVSIYELLAVTIVGVSLALLLQKPVWDTSGFAILSSVIAVVWNYAFNTGFETWEKHQTVKGRSRRRRLAHAIGFELGLLAILVPVMAWYLKITYVEAFLYDIGYAAFFLVYTYLFNLGFDMVFGLPESAR